MSQDTLDEIRESKGKTLSMISDLIIEWQQLEEQFDKSDDSTDIPRLYCGRIMEMLQDVEDELSSFKPTQFVLRS